MDVVNPRNTSECCSPHTSCVCATTCLPGQPATQALPAPRFRTSHVSSPGAYSSELSKYSAWWQRSIIKWRCSSRVRHSRDEGGGWQRWGGSRAPEWEGGPLSACNTHAHAVPVTTALSRCYRNVEASLPQQLFRILCCCGRHSRLCRSELQLACRTQNLVCRCFRHFFQEMDV